MEISEYPKFGSYIKMKKQGLTDPLDTYRYTQLQHRLLAKNCLLFFSTSYMASCIQKTGLFPKPKNANGPFLIACGLTSVALQTFFGSSKLNQMAVDLDDKYHPVYL